MYASTGAWSDSGRRMGLPSLHGGLWVALWACLPKSHGALMYLLQLLSGNVLLVAILGMPATTPQPAVASRAMTSAASIPRVSETSLPPTGMKQWHHSSDQWASVPRPDKEETAELDITPEEWPHQRWKEGRPMAKPLKETDERPSLRNSSGWLGEPTTWSTGLTMSMRGHTTSPLLSGKWWCLLTSWALRSMRCRRHGPGGKTSGPLTTWPRLPLKISASLGSCLPLNCLRSWAWGGFIPPRPHDCRVGCPSAHGAEKKGSMRVQW